MKNVGYSVKSLEEKISWVGNDIDNIEERIGWDYKTLDKKICDAVDDIKDIKETQDELVESVDALKDFLPPQCFTYNRFADSRRLTTSESPMKRFCDTTDPDQFNDDNTYTELDIEWKGNGWYRFTGGSTGAGFRMPDNSEVPARLRCGTGLTGYMADTHPSNFFETKDVTFCFRGRTGNCEKDTTGKVTNCGSFYVYYLVNVPDRCNLGYCGTNDALP